MKKHSKGLILILLIASMLLPILSKVVKAENGEEEIPLFTAGACGPVVPVRHWDCPVYSTSAGDYYLYNCLEPMMSIPMEWSGDPDDLIPTLATDWDIEERPEEMNDAGFISTGGIKSIEFTLREGVKFHDGSDWNATVAKWNIDRYYVIHGNITGASIDPAAMTAVTTLREVSYLDADEWAPYATTSWNMSSFIGGNSPYGEFGDSKSLVGKFPIVNKVEITESAQSGGKIKVTFNHWGTTVVYGLAMTWMISMETYKDYFDQPIPGYGQYSAFPQGDENVFPGHLIGTGPYKFVEHDPLVASGGRMVRNDDWWDAERQQNNGYHKIPEVAVSVYSHDEAGYQSRSNAMATGTIDFAWDRSWEPLSYQTMVETPSIEYRELTTEAYGELVILNCINETFFKHWSDIKLDGSTWYSAYTSLLGSSDEIVVKTGTNRAFRKAISYAFDYETWIETAMEDRVVRSGGFLGIHNEYYDPSIDLPERDLDIARQALIDDAHYGPIVVAKGLDIDSTDAEWEAVAESDPIYKFKLNYDNAHLETKNVLEESLKDIGCGIELTLDTSTYLKAVYYYSTFPWFTYDGMIFKPYYRDTANLGYIQAGYKSSSNLVEHNDYGYPITDYPTYPDYSSFPVPFWRSEAKTNYGFNYNVTCDEMIEKLWFQDSSTAQETYSELTDWIQNFQYPCIYLGQDKVGCAINKEWDYRFDFFTFRFHQVKVRTGGQPFVPGYPIFIVLGITITAFIGVIYTIMRIKK